MTTTTQSQIAEAVLAAGANPVLQRSLLDPTIPPSIGSQGYSVAGVGRAVVRVTMTRSGPRVRRVLTCPTFDAASTYDIDIGGGTYTATDATPADEATMWTDIAAALTSTVSGTDIAVTVDAVSGGSLTIDAPASDGAVAWTATGGSPSLAMTSDPGSCRARIYGRLSTTAGASHVPAGDASYPVVRDWGILATADGAVHDYAVTADGLTIPDLWVRPVDGVRVWVTDVAAVTDEACSPGTLTVRDPLAAVFPCTLGAS
jgi:hypothetical protein